MLWKHVWVEVSRYVFVATHQREMPYYVLHTYVQNM